MSIQIRPATSNDADTVHAMVRAIAAATGDEHKVRSTPADLARHWLVPGGLFEALLAESGGTAVGLSVFFPSFSTWRGQPGGYIQDFYVEESMRSTGLAERLLQATAAAVRGNGGTYLRLSVAAANERAQRFYARTGMEWSDDERIFVLDGDRFQDHADAAGQARE